MSILNPTVKEKIALQINGVARYNELIKYAHPKRIKRHKQLRKKLAVRLLKLLKGGRLND